MASVPHIITTLMEKAEKMTSSQRLRSLGRDWFHLSEAEEQVFGLSRERWPYLITVWQFYEGAIAITDDALSMAEEEALPSFSRSHREAHAVYWKQDFWGVREGLVTYSDEKDADSAAE